ncbi:MAG: response regulator transcription factor [Balneolaceae bacterium]
MKLKLVIVDDHPLVREGLKRVLEESETMVTVIGEASDVEELYEVLKDQQPDLIILDLELPGASGLEALKGLKSKYPEIPILIFSMHSEERFGVRVLKAGASGFITKTSIPEELEKAMDVILNKKKKYVSANVAEALAEQVNSDISQPLHETLSDREFEVMCMIASGEKISDIAEALNLSVRTIHTYRSRLLEKMNLHSNVEIAHYAIINNLISNPEEKYKPVRD